MSENDLTIRLQALDGQWETVGSDRLRGIVPQSFQATANEWGSDTCSFVLRRSTGAVHPDLTAFTPCRVEIAGMKVWSGRVKETPTQDGTDEAITVQGEGMQYHLDDDVYDKVYVHTRLGDWLDWRTNVLADLTEYVTTWQIQVGDGAIVFTHSDTPTGAPRGAVYLDLGPGSQSARVVVEWEKNQWAGTATLSWKTKDVISDINGVGYTTLVTLTTATTSGTSAFTSTGRYVALMCDTSVAQAADRFLRITAVKVFADTAYEAGNMSTLTADDVVNDAVDRATLLLSDDRSQIQVGTFVIDEYAPSGARSPREAISGINAYENYETKIDVDDRICFRPRPAAPIYEIGEWSGADFSDASTNSGEDIFNRVLVQGTGPAGDQLSVERFSGEQTGIPLIRPTSPVADNPSFDTNTTGWTVTGGSTITRNTTGGEYDTSPAAGTWGSLTAGATLTTTFTGTFTAGLSYRLDLAVRRQNAQTAFGFAFGLLGVDETRKPPVYNPGTFYTHDPNYYIFSLSWTPDADRTGVTFQLFAPGGVDTIPSFLIVDSLVLWRSLATLLDRRGFRRTRILPVSSAITTPVGTRIADLFLAAHKTTPFRGGFKATGRGGVRKVLGGGSVHPAWLLRDTGQLVRCSHRADPDTGAWTRSGRIATVSYDHDSLTATVALDEDREGLEVLLSRRALATSQGPA